MTQRHDDPSEPGPRQNHDVVVVDGLIKMPEPTWHMSEEQQARLDNIFASARRSRELRQQSIAARGGPEPYPRIRGYTHLWVIKDEASAQTQTIVADVQALAAQCEFKMRKARSKYEDFTLGPDRISLIAQVDACGTFNYPPDWKLNVECGVPVGYGKCTTDAKPYDALVGAALLAIKHHLRDDVIVRPAGLPQHPSWQAAKALFASTFPEREISVLDNWPGRHAKAGNARAAPDDGHEDCLLGEPDTAN